MRRLPKTHRSKTRPEIPRHRVGSGPGTLPGSEFPGWTPGWEEHRPSSSRIQAETRVYGVRSFQTDSSHGSDSSQGAGSAAGVVPRGFSPTAGVGRRLRPASGRTSRPIRNRPFLSTPIAIWPNLPWKTIRFGVFGAGPEGGAPARETAAEPSGRISIDISFPAVSVRTRAFLRARFRVAAGTEGGGLRGPGPARTMIRGSFAPPFGRAFNRIIGRDPGLELWSPIALPSQAFRALELCRAADDP